MAGNDSRIVGSLDCQSAGHRSLLAVVFPTERQHLGTLPEQFPCLGIRRTALYDVIPVEYLLQHLFPSSADGLLADSHMGRYARIASHHGLQLRAMGVRRPTCLLCFLRFSVFLSSKLYKERMCSQQK